MIASSEYINKPWKFHKTWEISWPPLVYRKGLDFMKKFTFYSLQKKT